MKYRLHKLLAVSIGIFLLLWFVSGIAMMLPSTIRRSAERPAPAVNFPALRISPAEAVANLTKTLGMPAEVNGLGMIQIHDLIAYNIIVRAGESYLINAASGQLFTITPEVAGQLAQEEFATGADIREIVRLTERDSAYLRGPLPVYRVVFNDPSSTISHVSATDGTVRRSNRWSRLRDRIIQFHTFETFLIGHEKLRRGFLLLLCLLGLAAVATGYNLAVPSRRRHVPAPLQ